MPNPQHLCPKKVGYDILYLENFVCKKIYLIDVLQEELWLYHTKNYLSYWLIGTWRRKNWRNYQEFLIFCNEETECQEMHDEIIKYLIYLRDRAAVEEFPSEGAAGPWDSGKKTWQDLLSGLWESGCRYADGGRGESSLWEWVNIKEKGTGHSLRRKNKSRSGVNEINYSVVLWYEKLRLR